jgi:hypothetical protein
MSNDCDLEEPVLLESLVKLRDTIDKVTDSPEDSFDH